MRTLLTLAAVEKLRSIPSTQPKEVGGKGGNGGGNANSHLFLCDVIKVKVKSVLKSPYPTRMLRLDDNMAQANNDLVTGRKVTTKTTGINVGKGSGKGYEGQECSNPATMATEASARWTIGKLIELVCLLKLRHW